MPRMEMDDRVLAYEVHGPAREASQALLLLHGLGSSCADWRPQIAAFENTSRVIAVDLAGHGGSARARMLPTVEAMAADVEAVLDAQDVGMVDAVGLSIGGCVALALALRAPRRVRSLVVVNAFARLTPAGLRAASRMAIRIVLLLCAPMSMVGAYVARGLFPRDDQRALRAAATARLSTNGRLAYVAAMSAVVRFDVRRRLGEIRCPTLVVAGERDTTIPLSAKHALVRGIPRARLVVVPDSGHVTNLDQPAAFNRIVEAFLRDR